MKERRGHKQRAIEEEWKMDFWEVIRIFAEKGYSRRATARAIGMHHVAFHQLLGRHEDKDPFERNISIPAAYVKDTGEPFNDAVFRLAAIMGIKRMAVVLGYAGHCPLRKAMKNRGLWERFKDIRNQALTS